MDQDRLKPLLGGLLVLDLLRVLGAAGRPFPVHRSRPPMRAGQGK
jgi:hypothetical protein